MTKEIQLTQGKIAIVDDDDFEIVEKMKWCTQRIGKKFYAVSKLFGKRIYMHSFIMKPPKGFVTDHADNDGLNNQRINLRVCTRSQNSANQAISGINASGYKGIHWREHKKKYQVYICVERKIHYLGYYSNKEDAAHAYDKAAKKYFKDFAVLNFPIP